MMGIGLFDSGKVDADGRITISEEELRAMVRTHIDQWLAQQSDAPAEDALHGPDDLRKTSAQQRTENQD